MGLIDADELIEHVWRDRVDSRERIANLVESMPTIKAIPAADVVPVVHARWNQLDNGGFVCSVCMGGYKTQPTRMGKPMFEYCPICGAKMDGGDEHEAD